jgi:hypothetical protein
MKKSLLVATALIASSIAGSAYALDTDVPRVLQVDSIHASLGVLTFLPLGVDGPFCDYLTNWYSPFNPNDVNLCLLQELRTNFAPSCIVNERLDVITIVQSDPSLCAGFNIKGENILGASLMLSENGLGLSGIATFVCGGFAQTYPVITC